MVGEHVLVIEKIKKNAGKFYAGGNDQVSACFGFFLFCCWKILFCLFFRHTQKTQVQKVSAFHKAEAQKTNIGNVTQTSVWHLSSWSFWKLPLSPFIQLALFTLQKNSSCNYWIEQCLAYHKLSSLPREVFSLLVFTNLQYFLSFISPSQNK